MNRMRSVLRKAVYLGVAGLAVGGTGLIVLTQFPALRNPQPSDRTLSAEDKQCINSKLLTRSQQLACLWEKEYDVLVVGGGATGCGVALDAVSRGLETALVEKFDFASGTSSRSTKLIHGGVRYLQKAIFNLDMEQYRMVKEALAERANLLEIAPHLAYPLPIMLPVYKWWQVPYFWVGIKCYDLVAGRQCLKPSYFLSKSKALELFPMLKNDHLCGALVYYDGQHDDARMCLAIALTATRMGATIANHCEVINVLKTINCKTGKEVVCGVRVRDRLTLDEWNIKAKVVVNATGPHTDVVRTLDNQEVKKICQPSSGIHIVLPDYYSPAKMGLLDPATSDGRIIFFLPWQNMTMAGTTDSPCAISDNPSPTEAEIQFILNEIRHYLNPDVNVRRGDVLSAWSGIRPLVLNPNAKDTQSIARNHIIEVSKSNLITIAGGKWTTYRHMAEETVDMVVKVGDFEAKPCNTKGLLLDGAHTWSPTMFIRLIQDFGLDSDMAQHLSNTYGDKAFSIAKGACLTGKRWPLVGRRLHEDYPYIEAEVVHAVREYACTAVDILARRTRIAFLNVHAAEESLPRIIEILAQELNWSKKRQADEREHALRFLRLEMGLNLKTQSENVPINFTKDEITMYINRFRSLDYDNKGFISIRDLRKYFKNAGEALLEDQLHEILCEVDLNKNGEVDLGEFLQLMSAIKTGAVSQSRFARAAELNEVDEAKRHPTVTVSRSGGGV